MTNSLESHAVNYIRPNRRHLADLPEPGQEWRTHEATKWIADHVTQLLNRNIITRERKVIEREDDISRLRGVYTTNPRAYDLIQEYVESHEDGYLPCGHDSIRNDPDVDGVVCKICETTHTREEVLEQ